MDASKPIVLAGRFWEPLVGLIAQQDPESTHWLTQAADAAEVVAHVVQSVL
jgi:hypothetical protein